MFIMNGFSVRFKYLQCAHIREKAPYTSSDSDVTLRDKW